SCDNFFRISSVRMFANTLKETHNFLRSIRCDRCRTSSDNLQFLGQSCKHVFCWSCINEMFTGESFVQCPLCALPLDLRHPSPATSINQFFQHLLSLKEHLSKLDVTKVNKHELAILAEPDRQKRTVDEFCATQRMALIGGDLDEEEEDFRQEAALAECDDQSSARVVDERSIVSDESSRVKAAVSDALRRNDIIVNALLRLYAIVLPNRVHDIRCESSSSTSRTFEEGSVISNESSRVKKAIDDALKRNDVAVEGLLRQYAASAHCTSSHSASSAQGNTLPKEISDGLQLGHPSAGVKLFSQLSQETKYPEDMEITSMTQQLPIFKEPDEYIFFKRRPSATFAKGAVNLRGMEVKNAYNGDEFAGHASGTVTHMTRNRSRLSHRKGENVLITAAVTGRRQLMVEALESGEDANQRDKSGYTAMHHAAAVNSLDLCKILVENGAVINAYGEFSFLRFCVLSPTDFLILSEANFDLLK
uniref:BRCA1-associated RING domain protein 1 n=2 Tax=Parascaris univalens TaxID=6257 RepID=A0A915BRY6_PARUN